MNAPSVDIDSIVIGAGVVGLAVARALAQSGREVFVLEAEARAGEGISSRNSGVIHAGLYYAQGSLKARLCVRGRHLLYDFCAKRGVTHRRTGKLVVATDWLESEALHVVLQRAEANGVDGLRLIDANEVRRIEPSLHGVAAIESTASGIVDVAEYVMALIGELEQAGGRVACETRVTAVRCEAGAFDVALAGGDRVRCRRLINAAGLTSTQVARTIDELAEHHIPRQFYASGHYYRLRGKSPFSRLIYPMPQAAGLGVHLGMDSAGQVHFGPDVRWIDAPNYQFDDSQHVAFADSIRRWWPSLRDDQLEPDFVGVRPKLVGPGQSSGDFVIQDVTTHGISNLINLFGIESPGLTSSLAIGEEVAARLTRA
ncbi:MAG TPA: NAD(P)/FAD-dependent oxidoreductase [Pseudomonadota bacterium]|nr:NAD(P)/FAD-dependent oxidoreductase [Rhodanobacteraceae bacterium]MBP9153955.1 NAD(P)/FAD-dependent oxidoreductase [Xanthomonadales bacterium]HQW82229.1 NAD(P)/FAD-dependent oxidoreductase [Pseudomonadota bacterium]